MACRRTLWWRSGLCAGVGVRAVPLTSRCCPAPRRAPFHSTAVHAVAEEVRGGVAVASTSYIRVEF